MSWNTSFSLRGPTGVTGPTGPTGAVGQTGTTNTATGPTGPAGFIGLPGPQNNSGLVNAWGTTAQMFNSQTFTTLSIGICDIPRGGVIAPNGKIYTMADWSNQFGTTTMPVIDPSNDSVTTIAISPLYTDCASIAAHNGNIYTFHNSGIRIINTTTNAITNIADPTGTNIQRYMWSSVLAPNGKIYGVPIGGSAGTQIYVFNTNDNTAYTLSGNTSGFNYLGGVLAPNGKIYCIPYGNVSGQANMPVLVINTNNDTVYTFGSIPLSMNSGAGYAGGVLGPTGNIYAFPIGTNTNFKNILFINPNTDFVTAFAGGSVTGPYAGGVCAADGLIYAAPQSANKAILVINPYTETVSTIAASSDTNGYTGAVLAPNGKIYFFPSFLNNPFNPGARSVGILKPKLPTAISGWMLSPEFNKF